MLYALMYVFEVTGVATSILTCLFGRYAGRDGYGLRYSASTRLFKALRCVSDSYGALPFEVRPQSVLLEDFGVAKCGFLYWYRLARVVLVRYSFPQQAVLV